MSEGLFSRVELSGDQLAGYRLQHLEVFNWGTFDSQVWRLTPGSETALLTGDIGSGKSTLVDALTTLLLPAHRISYNKAAGADAKERTLRSYVEGHYKSERIEATGTSRPVGLRDHRQYSVILGVFANEGFDETITLAQVFHQKDRTGQPDRFLPHLDQVAVDRGRVHQLRDGPQRPAAPVAGRRGRDPHRLPRVRAADATPAGHQVRAGHGVVPSDGVHEVGR